MKISMTLKELREYLEENAEFLDFGLSREVYTRNQRWVWKLPYDGSLDDGDRGNLFTLVRTRVQTAVKIVVYTRQLLDSSSAIRILIDFGVIESKGSVALEQAKSDDAVYLQLVNSMKEAFETDIEQQLNSR